MSVFETESGVALNTDYIVLVGKICYNNTNEKYYFTIVLSNMEANLNMEFDTEEKAKTERYRLIRVMTYGNEL